MKIERIIKSLLAVVVALMATACTPVQTVPNDVNFSVGETVGHNTKQQFLSITSAQAWSIALDYITPEGESEWCSLSKTEGEGNANIFMTFGENKLTEDRVVNITVTFPAETITRTFTQRALSNSTDNEDLSGWLELPAFEADGTRTYFSKHMLPSSGYTERSFSLLYDSDIYHSLWVAYPISKLHTPGSGSRQDDWGRYDQNIPKEKQVYLKSSFNGSYDRGHLCPAATRFHPYTTENCKELSVPTNMSPQLSGLNQNKWEGIERQVRNWGSKGCDTLYVVTGAVFKTVGGNESINYTYSKSDSSKRVAIPNYYYKALLQRKGTGANSSFQALAIWVPHKAATGGVTLNDVITIDELEERTGIDFFPNLDDATENKVESDIDARYWGL